MRMLSIVLSAVATAIFLSCYPPRFLQHTKNADTSAATTDTSRAAETQRASPPDQEPKPGPARLPSGNLSPGPQRAPMAPFVGVEQWSGKTFILLERVEMFRKYGHHLYTTAALEDDPRPANPAIELPNHRLKYEPFAGRSLRVFRVEKHDDGEYLVTAEVDTLNLTVYGRTTDGIIEGLLLMDDLAAAMQRWAGSTVYSRRRMIDRYDSTGSKFTNQKISILEPLRVLEVRAGIIPLPPKPIWLIVERSDKSRGIIPVLRSWTNVLPEKRHPGMPWEYDILEQDPKKLHPGWDPYTWETIDKHSVHEGMTQEQVEMSWGYPRDSTRLDAERVEWVFGNSRLVFRGNSLETIGGN